MTNPDSFKMTSLDSSNVITAATSKKAAAVGSANKKSCTRRGLIRYSDMDSGESSHTDHYHWGMDKVSIRIQCPKCGEQSGIHERMTGRRVHCPKCEAELAVPALEQVSGSNGPTVRPQDSDQLGDLASVASAGVVLTADQEFEADEALADRSGDPGFEQLPIGHSSNREETEMDMTPMVDVTFLLLIFFMVTASFALQKAVPLPVQQTDAPSSNPVEPDDDPPEQVTLQIDEFGGYFVLAATFEREVAGKPSLVSTLREAKEGLSGEVRLSIECQEKALLESLVDAMDAGAINEYSEFQISQVDVF